MHKARALLHKKFQQKLKQTSTENETETEGARYYPAPRRRFDCEESAVRELIQSVSSQQPTSIVAGTWDVNYILIPGFYFLLGAFLATPSLAIKYFAIRVLQIPPGYFGFVYGFAVFPWFLKSLWGLWSDTKPLFGRHRVPYLIGSSALGAVTWIGLAVPGAHSRTVLGFGVLIIFTNVFTCFADVIMDCLVAKAARAEMHGEHKGRSQTRAWAFRHAGSLVGIVLGAYLVDNVKSLHHVFAVTAVFPVILLFGSFFLVEEIVDGARLSEPFCAQARDAVAEIKHGDELKNLAKFIMLYGSTPNSGLTFTFYLIESLHFSEKFMGALSIVAVVAMIAGLGTYMLFLRKMPVRRIMRIAIVIGTLLAIMPLCLVTGTNRRFGIDDHFFSMGDDVAEAYASQIAQMPILISIAAVCPEGSEGLVYSGLISLSNFSGAISTWGGAAITHALGIQKGSYGNMWLLVLVCTASNVVPYFFVHWIPTRSDSHVVISIPKMLTDDEPHKLVA